jgi:hypothetical protein
MCACASCERLRAFRPNVLFDCSGLHGALLGTLDWAVSNFFACGSPMALFGAMLNAELFTAGYRLPTCSRLYNLFHPFDPIACATATPQHQSENAAEHQMVALRLPCTTRTRTHIRTH